MPICGMLETKSPEEIMSDLYLYLLKVFPPKPRKVGATKVGEQVIRSKKQARRVEYARAQDLWRKNRSKCLRIILNDVTDISFPPMEEMTSYWKTVMKNNVKVSQGVDTQRSILREL